MIDTNRIRLVGQLMRDEFRRSRYWVYVNIAELIAYLLFESFFWAPYGEEGLLGGPGDPIIQGFFVLPLLLLMIVLNLIWVTITLYKVLQQSNWKPFFVWLIVIFIWFGAVQYDRSRQYTGDLMNEADLSPGLPVANPRHPFSCPANVHKVQNVHQQTGPTPCPATKK